MSTLKWIMVACLAGGLGAAWGVRVSRTSAPPRMAADDPRLQTPPVALSPEATALGAWRDWRLHPGSQSPAELGLAVNDPSALRIMVKPESLPPHSAVEFYRDARPVRQGQQLILQVSLRSQQPRAMIVFLRSGEYGRPLTKTGEVSLTDSWRRWQFRLCVERDDDNPALTLGVRGTQGETMIRDLRLVDAAGQDREEGAAAMALGDVVATDLGEPAGPPSITPDSNSP